MNRVEIFILFFLSTLIFVCGGRSEVIRQDSLSATTMSPNEGETQYVGSAYINGGTYESGSHCQLWKGSPLEVVDFQKSDCFSSHYPW